ncbi:hypothetical protein K438DRAFT_1769898 [Mycena galopus ATCC 62051]|nr:hypothetical protein K438DRAFT_1769898 [Mycena galopus ATCC 62051]
MNFSRLPAFSYRHIQAICGLGATMVDLSFGIYVIKEKGQPVIINVFHDIHDAAACPAHSCTDTSVLIPHFVNPKFYEPDFGITAPIPDASNNIFQQCIQAGGDELDCAQQSETPTCSTGVITTNLADLQLTVNDIQHVGLVAPDPLAADQGGATLATLVTALDAASTANAAGDFATVVTSLQTIINTTNTFLGPLLEDGEELGDDRTVSQTASDTLSIAQLCANA